MSPSTEPSTLPFEVKPEAKQAQVDAGAQVQSQTIASLADGTWKIQIGSYPTKEDAVVKLEKLRVNGPPELRDKPAFTVTIQKGAETTYRARFSGFTEKEAREACANFLKKSLSCQVLAPSS